jgi:2'-5' RNA ligase
MREKVWIGHFLDNQPVGEGFEDFPAHITLVSPVEGQYSEDLDRALQEIAGHFKPIVAKTGSKANFTDEHGNPVPVRLIAENLALRALYTYLVPTVREHSKTAKIWVDEPHRFSPHITLHEPQTRIRENQQIKIDKLSVVSYKPNSREKMVVRNLPMGAIALGRELHSDNQKW